MAQRPVVFVPGFSGSFNLPVLLDWRGPTLSGWNFPPFVDYGQGLLEAFRKAGYRRNRDLFVAFYDWRGAVRDSARNYLMPWIERALRRSDFNEVDLVCHSMGGLVARSYIQSSDYRGDVARLITLGTPHQGSAESYYPWAGGDLRVSGMVRTVLNVYLWYLEHTNPFTTGLDRLRTIRTLIPGVGDLLSTVDYLIDQASPATFKPEELMQLRNSWVDIMNDPGGLDTLFGRVPVTTISGHNFQTLHAILVDAPPHPPGEPPKFPDGTPVDDRFVGDGDGTVLRSSAQVADNRAANLDPQQVAHDKLADDPATLAQVMQTIGMPMPEISAPASGPQLVVMTASPVEITVEPVTAAGILGAAPTAPPGRRMPRTRDYGHSGKHLNMLILPQSEAGTYNVQLHGTATGHFSIGALMIGAQAAPILGTGAAGDRAPMSEIDTMEGDIDTESELIYQVEVSDPSLPPRISFNREATMLNCIKRLGGAVRAQPPILGMAPQDAAGAQVRGTLAATGAADDVRNRLDAALAADDNAATVDVMTMLGGGDRQDEMAAALSQIAERVVGPSDTQLAAGLIAQIRRVAST